jgi:hypothetical protein
MKINSRKRQWKVATRAIPNGRKAKGFVFLNVLVGTDGNNNIVNIDGSNPGYCVLRTIKVQISDLLFWHVSTGELMPFEFFP